MAGRKKLTDRIKGLDEALRTQWFNELKNAEAEHRKPEAVRVWRAYNKYQPGKNSGPVSQKVGLTYVEKIVKTFVPDAVDGEAGVSGIQALFSRVPRYKPWVPWGNSEETPEEAKLLLRLNTVKELKFGVQLHEHEVAWARRLRPAFSGLNVYGQFALIDLYGLREYARVYFGTEQTYTEDLDGLVTYRAWDSANMEAYLDAVGEAFIPYPNLIDRWLGSNLEPPLPEKTESQPDDGLQPAMNWRSWLQGELNRFFTPGETWVGNDDDTETQVRDKLLAYWGTITD